MHPVRKRKLIIILFVAVVLIIFTTLILLALRQNLNFFFSPTQIVKGEAVKYNNIRLGGMVEQGSIVREDGIKIRFRLTDFHYSIVVKYEGILPDLFREGQGLIAFGKMNQQQEFQADSILAKHDANYMPPEVKQMLARN